MLVSEPPLTRTFLPGPQCLKRISPLLPSFPRYYLLPTPNFTCKIIILLILRIFQKKKKVIELAAIEINGEAMLGAWDCQEALAEFDLSHFLRKKAEGPMHWEGSC